MVESHTSRRFAALFLIAAFAVLVLGRWIAPVNRVALSAAAPFTAVASGIGTTVSDALSGIFDGGQLRQEVRTLQERNAALLRQTIADAEARHENAIFRRMLRFSVNNSRLDLLPARVIGSDANSLVPDVLLNRGTHDGVHAGMTVVDDNGYFVGSIVGAGYNWSRVQIMLSPSSSVGAYDTRSRAHGLVEGQYGGNPELTTVVASMSLRPGDAILTSGQCNLFPRGLVLGQVMRVEHRNVAVYQTAVMRPAADFRDLEIVSIVRNFVPPLPARLHCQP